MVRGELPRVVAPDTQNSGAGRWLSHMEAERLIKDAGEYVQPSPSSVPPSSAKLITLVHTHTHDQSHRHECRVAAAANFSGAH